MLSVLLDKVHGSFEILVCNGAHYFNILCCNLYTEGELLSSYLIDLQWHPRVSSRNFILGGGGAHGSRGLYGHDEGRLYS